MICKGSTLYAVIPMAVFNQDNHIVACSPYGGSYGGPVFAAPPSYRDSKELIDLFLTDLQNLEVQEIKFTLPILPCYRVACETFRFTLLENGFKVVNRDISSLLALRQQGDIEGALSARARRMARKAAKLGVEIKHRTSVDAFWQVLHETFQRLELTPTHTQQEFQWLVDTLPGRVFVDLAYFERSPVAGIGYLVANDRVISSFYLCQTDTGRQTQALSLLVLEGLRSAQAAGFQWFDFGTSSIQMQAVPGVFEFKENFHTVGVFRDTYVWTR